MNKKLLGAAIIAAAMTSGPVAADVKLFGVIQAETSHVDIDKLGGQKISTTYTGESLGAHGATVGGGPNQWGIKGTEKLGNGLSAYFKFNNSFSTFDSSNAAGARDRYLGVKGDGWHVQFGRMNSTYKGASAKYDPAHATGFQSRAVGTLSGAHNGYINDVGEFGFKSGGLSGAVQVTWADKLGTNKTVGGSRSQQDSGSWNGMLKYSDKHWEIGLAHIDVDYGKVNGVDQGDLDMTKVFGKYSMGGFTFTAQYEHGSASDAAAGASSTTTTAEVINRRASGPLDEPNRGQIFAAADANALAAIEAVSGNLKVRNAAGVLITMSAAQRATLFAANNDNELREAVDVIGGNSPDASANLVFVTDVNVPARTTTRSTRNNPLRFDSGSASMFNQGATMLGLMQSQKKFKAFHLGLTYQINDNAVLLTHYGDSTTEELESDGGNDVDVRNWLIGLGYGLSKRTLVYTGYVDNKFKIKGAKDVDVSAYGIGVRHSF